MTEIELWQRIAKRAYKDDAKALEAYLMTQQRIVWAEKKLAELEKKQAMKGIEAAFQALSAN